MFKGSKSLSLFRKNFQLVLWTIQRRSKIIEGPKIPIMTSLAFLRYRIVSALGHLCRGDCRG